MVQYRNILIIKLSAIGDVIHALPVAAALKQCFPAAKLTWIVEKPAYNLLTNNPNIDEIIIFDKPRYKNIAGMLSYGSEIAGLLKSHKFDLCLDIQGLFKSAALAFLSGAPKRIGYCNMREFSDWVSKPVLGPNRQGHIVERYLDVVRSLGCNVQQVDFGINITLQEEQEARAIAAAAGLDTDARYLVLAPGTNWPTKCWPTTHFAKLIAMMASDNLTPVIIGGPADQSLAAEIITNTAVKVVDVTGKTSLKQLAYLIKQAVIFVGGDTGPMHLATAVKTPVVALFGPTDPNRNGPYGDGHQVIAASLACAGCWQRKCDKDNCMAAISPEMVFEAVEKMLARLTDNDER